MTNQVNEGVMPRREGADSRRLGWVAAILACALLLMMGLLAGGAALRESATIDEIAHLGAGVSYLQKLDMRLNGEHPPLAKVIAALPLVLRGVRADYTSLPWTLSDQYFQSAFGEWAFGNWFLTRWNNSATVLAWGRLPMLLLTLALGWAVFAYGRQLGGHWGGLLCVTLYATAPVFLTFGPLVLTDVAVTLFSLLALWALANLWREPSRRNEWTFAAWLAAALLSKFSAGLLLLCFLAFGLSTRWRAVPGQPANKEEARAWRKTRRWATRRGVLWAAIIVYAVYLVLSSKQSTDALSFLGQGIGALGLRRVLFPVLLYLRGIFWVLITLSRPTFLLGHVYRHGVWFFFPVVFVLKSTLGFLGLLVMAPALALLLRKGAARSGAPIVREAMGLHWRVLWIGLVIHTAACLVSRMTISIRHFAMPYVLLILLIAPLPRLLQRLLELRPVAGWILTAACALLALSSLAAAFLAYPNYFPYVNALRFGRPAYELMSDSNVDWNQALPEVRKFANARKLQRVPVDYYGIVEPAGVVPGAETWNCQTPSPQDAGHWAFLSADLLEDGHNCVWLMNYRHVSLAGGSMYAVQLPGAIPPMGSPGGPPAPSERHLLFDLGGTGIDYRAMMVRGTEHPEEIPEMLKEMQRLFREQSRK